MAGSMVNLDDKVEKLLALLKSFRSCAVAFSGGLDSSVLAKAAQMSLRNDAVAVTGVSDSIARAELDGCRSMADQIGIRHHLIDTDELSNTDYQRNTADRCYHCKNELFAKLKVLANELNIEIIVDGSNIDDDKEHRPGRRAAAELGVRSPLAECQLTKEELRQIAADWQLPIWNKPATPCLSSRIAYGETVTSERLAMVERAEAFLRKRGFEPLRVRYHKGDVARIEVLKAQMPKIFDAVFQESLTEHLHEIGFKYISVDLEGFRSGSLNEMLATEDLEIRSSR